MEMVNLNTCKHGNKATVAMPGIGYSIGDRHCLRPGVLVQVCNGCGSVWHFDNQVREWKRDLPSDYTLSMDDSTLRAGVQHLIDSGELRMSSDRVGYDYPDIDSSGEGGTRDGEEDDATEVDGSHGVQIAGAGTGDQSAVPTPTGDGDGRQGRG